MVTAFGAAERLARRAGARTFLFGSGLLFGLSAVLAKVATRGPGGMSGAQATAVRFALGLAFVALLFRARPGTFRPVQHRLLVARGLFGGVAALLYFVAISSISPGEATLLNNTFPIWAVVISFFLLRERPTLHLAVALAIASLGAYLVMGRARRLPPGLRPGGRHRLGNLRRRGRHLDPGAAPHRERADHLLRVRRRRAGGLAPVRGRRVAHVAPALDCGHRDGGRGVRGAVADDPVLR